MSDDDVTTLNFMMTACLLLALIVSRMPVVHADLPGVDLMTVIKAQACVDCDPAAIQLAP